MYIWVCVSKCHMCVCTSGSLKRALWPLELEFQMVMSCLVWVLGPKLSSVEE